MPKQKSILKTHCIEFAGRAHNCQHNKRHRINKGDIRLTISEDGNKLHYCKECALAILTKDIETLNEKLARFRET